MNVRQLRMRKHLRFISIILIERNNKRSNTMDLEIDNAKLLEILNAYKKKVEYDYNRYHTKIKDNEEEMEKRREISRVHYLKNKDKKKEYYENNKQRSRLLSLKRYYKDRMDELKERLPFEYEMMIEYNIIQSLHPPHQTSTVQDHQVPPDA